MFVRLKIRDPSHVHASFLFLFQLSVRSLWTDFFVRRANLLSLAHLLLSVVRSTLL